MLDQVTTIDQLQQWITLHIVSYQLCDPVAACLCVCVCALYFSAAGQVLSAELQGVATLHPLATNLLVIAGPAQTGRQRYSHAHARLTRPLVYVGFTVYMRHQPQTLRGK